MIWDNDPSFTNGSVPGPGLGNNSAAEVSPATNHQALYRKWRSRSFDDVVGQEHVTRTLRNAVITSTVGHAYLFTGSRGTGKTSTARVLARAVNCLNPTDGNPCNVCRICTSMEERRSLDLVEIDAASNNSVDDIRDLRDKVGYAPTEARRKVYIIDEVHMLSPSAFNALLKTLEEPPRHILFVLATTEVHRVPATILSRCQRFDFRPISPADTMARLAYICAEEGITADPAALDALARYATGSLRDAVGLLDQVRAYCGATIGLDDVQEALGIADPRKLQDLAGLLLGGDLARALQLVDEMAAHGADLRQFGRQVVSYWRDLLIARARNAWPAALGDQAPSAAAIAGVIKAFLQADAGAKRSTASQLYIELALLDAVVCLSPAEAAAPVAAPLATSPARVTTPPPSTARPADGSRARPAPPRGADPLPGPPPSDPKPDPVPATVSGDAARSLTLEAVEEAWPRVRQSLRKSKPRIAALLNGSCRPLRMGPDGMVLGFLADFSFHRAQIDDPATRRVIEEALGQQLGRPCAIRCVMIGEQVDNSVEASDSPVSSTPADSIQTPQPPVSSVSVTDFSEMREAPLIVDEPLSVQSPMVVQAPTVMPPPSSRETARVIDPPQDDFMSLAARALREVHVQRESTPHLPFDVDDEEM